MQLNNDTNLPKHIRDWLHRRGINDTIIDAFSITYDYTELIPNGAIILPVNHPDGEFSFNKYRRDPLEDKKPKYLYDRGGKVTLYGADQLIKYAAKTMPMDVESVTDLSPTKHKVVITEGELDALVLWSKNIPAVSSTGGSSSFQEDWVLLLQNYDVHICFDNDDAGAAGMVKVLKYLPDAKVIFVPEVIGVKDISDFVGKGGDFHALMQSAQAFKNIEEVEADKQKRAGLWQPVRFHNAYIDANRPRVYSTKVDAYKGNDQVLKAKSYPCTELLEFNRQKNALCQWHNDSTPSLHYYEKTNTCYCHACGKYADAIDIFMHQHHNLSFTDAVEELCKKI